MPRKQTKEKKDVMPAPPEPEFFDKPDLGEQSRFFIRDLFGNRWALLTVAVMVSVMLAMFFFAPKGKKETTAAKRTEEKRALVTTSAMDRAIDVASKETRKPSFERGEPVPAAKKRGYASDIAVYLFKENREERNPSLRREFHNAQGPLGLPSGTKIPALLSNRVFSFNVAAPVLAIIAKDFIWQGEVVIPKDSRILGEASVLKSLDRINVTFDILIFPDGREMRIRGMALSEDGSNGIKGRVEKHRDVKVLKAIGETLLGGASLFVGNTRRDPFSLEDQIRLNAAQNLTNQATQDLRSIRVNQSITVEAYTAVQVILLEAI
jgi:hypothetical protein